MIELSDIQSAKERLKDIARTTPVIYSNSVSNRLNAQVYFKCENFQRTGSFKVRGAANKIAKSNSNEFITASAGNHAQGVALSATRLNARSTVVMPAYAPLAKVDATKAYGANVILHGECFDEACEYALNYEADAEFIHPFNDEDVIAGQGTVGLEILEQIPDVDVVIVPAGGGGFLSGVACALKSINPKVEVIGVQAENANAIAQSFKANELLHTDSASTLADGIAVKNPGDKCFELINKYVDDIVTVSDDDIAHAVLYLLERCKIVVEAAGAAPLAATLNLNLKGKKVCLVLSGGNIDVNTISSIIEKGLIFRYRKVEIVVKAPDKPKELKRIFDIVVDNGANVLACTVDKFSLEQKFGKQLIYLVCETRGKEHCDKLFSALTKEGYEVE